MVERVARAIRQECEGCDPRDDKAFESAARAAIAAMREPTERIVAQGGRFCGDERGNPDELQARHLWEIMIDAALEQRGE